MPSHCLASGQREQRTKTFAAVQHGVAHRITQSGGRMGRAPSETVLARPPILLRFTPNDERRARLSSDHCIVHWCVPRFELAALKNLDLMLDGFKPRARQNASNSAPR